MKYELKAIKMAGGDETPRFEANITLDGKKIGIAYNEGCGVCNFYQFINNADGEKFFAFCKEQSTEKEDDANDAAESWTYAELDKWEERKTLLRWSKKATIFIVKGD